jgi:hypothetical protein
VRRVSPANKSHVIYTNRHHLDIVERSRLLTAADHKAPLAERVSAMRNAAYEKYPPCPPPSRVFKTGASGGAAARLPSGFYRPSPSPVRRWVERGSPGGRGGDEVSGIRSRKRVSNVKPPGRALLARGQYVGAGVCNARSILQCAGALVRGPRHAWHVSVAENPTLSRGSAAPRWDARVLSCFRQHRIVKP